MNKRVSETEVMDAQGVTLEGRIVSDVRPTSHMNQATVIDAEGTSDIETLQDHFGMTFSNNSKILASQIHDCLKKIQSATAGGDSLFSNNFDLLHAHNRGLTKLLQAPGLRA